MPAEILEIREEEVHHFPRSVLSDVQAVALSRSEKFEIELASLLNGYTYGIRSRGWVGYIPVDHSLTIRVLPKVEVKHLFGMLEVAYQLRSFNIFEGEVAIKTIDELYERVVSILARRVIDRARKGLYRHYIAESDELPYVRGRMDSVATILNTFRGIPRISCEYEENTADLDDNRILLWTLHQVRRQAIRKTTVRRELDLARRALAGTVALMRFVAADCLGRKYHRLNSDYRSIHGLCRLILEHTGPDIAVGERQFVPFELNMPRLFELFVAEWLRAHPPKGMIVRSKYNVKVDADFKLSREMDIVFFHKGTGQPIALLDTKYKTSGKPEEADINQIAFYAHELNIKRALLIYPSNVSRPFTIHHGREMILEGLVFDIAMPLDEAGPAFVNAIEQRLEITLSDIPLSD